ncbi:hypothetical protein [Chitinophaga sp. XS-30]|uniref:hypothetical protein n=1 Tax=Chitinophaga sp. XS-30 TaxID=2604421 RepID=UPI0011DCD696|nr:hypothetical protein [Chitinophaga sp. XS-30]QEH42110.1 hypothetical protein FW415_15000 [Chitinophaga sp. XS-30]
MGKSIKTNREKMKQQLNPLWRYARKVVAAELDDDHDPSGFDETDSEKVSQTITVCTLPYNEKGRLFF